MGKKKKMYILTWAGIRIGIRVTSDEEFRIALYIINIITESYQTMYAIIIYLNRLARWIVFIRFFFFIQVVYIL